MRGGCSSSSTNDPTPATGCNAGETQKCTGPAGCTGGQVCTDAGTWGACDCGDAGSGICNKSDLPSCRLCCDGAVTGQTAAFEQAARYCTCTGDTACTTLCSTVCSADAGTSPSDACLLCATSKDNVGCITTACAGNGCAEYVACLASCVGG